MTASKVLQKAGFDQWLDYVSRERVKDQRLAVITYMIYKYHFKKYGFKQFSCRVQ
jgi:hypothetical protein